VLGARLAFESHRVRAFWGKIPRILHTYVGWQLGSTALVAKIRRGQSVKTPAKYLVCISDPLQISHDDSFCQLLKLILRFGDFCFSA